MLDSALQLILRQRLLTLLFGAILLVLGSFAWLNLPIDAFPDVTDVQVMILTEAKGLSPEEVERLVTFPVEIQMSGLPDVRLVRSLSQSGLSQVVVIFEDDVDTYFGCHPVQRVRHRYGRLRLRSDGIANYPGLAHKS